VSMDSSGPDVDASGHQLGRQEEAVCHGTNSTVLYFRGGQVKIMEKLGETVQQVMMKLQQRLGKSHTRTHIKQQRNQRVTGNWSQLSVKTLRLISTIVASLPEPAHITARTSGVAVLEASWVAPTPSDRRRAKIRTGLTELTGLVL
jgi:hypothetical protein